MYVSNLALKWRYSAILLMLAFDLVVLALFFASRGGVAEPWFGEEVITLRKFLLIYILSAVVAAQYLFRNEDNAERLKIALRAFEAAADRRINNMAEAHEAQIEWIRSEARTTFQQERAQFQQLRQQADLLDGMLQDQLQLNDELQGRFSMLETGQDRNEEVMSGRLASAPATRTTFSIPDMPTTDEDSTDRYNRCFDLSHTEPC
ncbi:hypothetical protein BCR34DRAFT_592993 [Clohesyomyces aquaticus]|uniref:Uncharacterized protein n=1 Tax=Clohesyomyces aquaticus TaxID=1231657 RepID=A0A1Y1YMB3_9PLEO|nr:hypothetical protein BCR34DRAFT_592993 [Clohesyomyces aquaticus]